MSPTVHSNYLISGTHRLQTAEVRLELCARIIQFPDAKDHNCVSHLSCSPMQFTYFKQAIIILPHYFSEFIEDNRLVDLVQAKQMETELELTIIRKKGTLIVSVPQERLVLHRLYRAQMEVAIYSDVVQRALHSQLCQSLGHSKSTNLFGINIY
jgi:hypothetical protein